MPILASLLLILATIFSVVFFGQRWVIYPRYVVPRAEAPPLPEGTARFEIPVDPEAEAHTAGPSADEGDAGSNTDEPFVEAWLLPADGATVGRPAPLVIFAHGNGESIDIWPEALRPYRARGIHVLLVEYRGYGRSGGLPSEDGITRDFARAYDLAVARPEVDGDRVAFHGRSLGGGVVCTLSRQRRAAAIILESTFTSLAPLARRMWMPSFLLRDRFDNLGAITDFEGPVLVIHGRGDTIVPFDHAEKLAAASDRVRLVATEHGHNDLPLQHPDRWNAIESLLTDAGILDPSIGSTEPMPPR